eukprot:5471041-Heterocapsa_arctica.AAC.1
MATERRTRQLLEESGAPSSSSTAALDEIKKRLVGFEGILRQDRGEASVVGPGVGQRAPPLPPPPLGPESPGETVA